jgi:hypothetical protein
MAKAIPVPLRVHERVVALPASIGARAPESLSAPSRGFEVILTTMMIGQNNPNRAPSTNMRM